MLTTGSNQKIVVFGRRHLATLEYGITKILRLFGLLGGGAQGVSDLKSLEMGARFIKNKNDSPLLMCMKKKKYFFAIECF